MSKSLLNIKFKAQRFRKWPSVKIYVDGDLLEEKVLEGDEVIASIPFDLLDGDHTLEIEHFGKSSKDTRFENNEILADTKFLVDQVTINEYIVPSSLMCRCTFKADWAKFDKPLDMPSVFKQSVIVGPNGVWSLPFTTPIDDWIMDQRSIDEGPKKIVTYESYEPSTDSTLYYKLTQEDRQIIKDIKELIG